MGLYIAFWLFSYVVLFVLIVCLVALFLPLAVILAIAGGIIYWRKRKSRPKFESPIYYSEEIRK